MLHKLFARSQQKISVLAGPFRGARVFLNPGNSKRKIFGLYEHILNDWIQQHIIGKSFVFDVGANTGYDTYGFAHLLIKNGVPKPSVVSFEPGDFVELDVPRTWREYSACNIDIVKRFVGSCSTDTMITLDAAYEQHVRDKTTSGLIKIDIEGAEVDALHGATSLLRCKTHDWLIEIHGKDRISEVAHFFVEQKRPFLIKELSPLPLIGKESRTIFTTWLVTI